MRTFIHLCSRLALTITRVALAGLARVFPAAPSLAARGFRKVFSPEVNMRLVGRVFLASKTLRRTEIEVSTLLVPIWLPLRVRISAGDYIQGSFYFEGYPSFAPTLLEFCDEDTLFFDIGANVGFISLAVSRVVPHRNIHAFEPSPPTFRRLRENFDRNCPEAHPHRLGLSSSPGRLTLRVPDIDSGSASLHHRGAAGIALHEQTAHCSEFEIELTTFDAFWQDHLATARQRKVALKMDVEGHELEALAGMTAFLARTDLRILFIIETRRENSAAVTRLLTRAGYHERQAFLAPRAADDEEWHHRDLVFTKDLAGPARA